MKKAARRSVFLLFTLVLAPQAIYALSFEPERENMKLQRGDWSILRKVPALKDSMHDFMKTNRLKVSKSSEDIFCIGKMSAKWNQPEGCYVGFRVQRVGYKDQYCSPTVGCAPCGLLMIYYRKTDHESFVSFSPQSRALAAGAIDRFFLSLDEENRSYCNTP